MLSTGLDSKLLHLIVAGNCVCSSINWSGRQCHECSIGYSGPTCARDQQIVTFRTVTLQPVPQSTKTPSTTPTRKIRSPTTKMATTMATTEYPRKSSKMTQHTTTPEKTTESQTIFINTVSSSPKFSTIKLDKSTVTPAVTTALDKSTVTPEVTTVVFPKTLPQDSSTKAHITSSQKSLLTTLVPSTAGSTVISRTVKDGAALTPTRRKTTSPPTVVPVTSLSPEIKTGIGVFSIPPYVNKENCTVLSVKSKEKG